MYVYVRFGECAIDYIHINIKPLKVKEKNGFFFLRKINSQIKKPNKNNKNKNIIAKFHENNNNKNKECEYKKKNC